MTLGPRTRPQRVTVQTAAGCNFGGRAAAEAQSWSPVSTLQPGRQGLPSSHKHPGKLCSQGWREECSACKGETGILSFAASWSLDHCAMSTRTSPGRGVPSDDGSSYSCSSGIAEGVAQREAGSRIGGMRVWPSWIVSGGSA